MTIDELLLFYKITAYVMGDKSIKLTNADKHMAYSCLKRLTDQREDWTVEQKEQFKQMVDICEQLDT